MPLDRLRRGSTRALVRNVLTTTGKAKLSHDSILPHRLCLSERLVRDLRDTREHCVHAHLLRRRPWVRARRGCKVVYRRRSFGYSWPSRRRKFSPWQNEACCLPIFPMLFADHRLL